MYMSNQILISKRGKKLARLMEKDTTFAWNNGKTTSLLTEDGKIITRNINNYTHLEDVYGRASSPGNFKEAKEMIKYTGKKEMKKALINWELKILKEMEISKYIICPFADGSMCFTMKDFFLKRRKAKAMFRRYDNFHKRFVSSSIKIFIHKGKKWAYDGDSELYRIEK